MQVMKATRYPTRNGLPSRPLFAVPLFAVLLLICPATAAADMIIVDRDAGIGPAPIVLYANAPPRTRDAAVTLAHYIERRCGMRPDLIEGMPQPLPDRAIWVGVQPVLNDVLPAINLDFQHPEEILIAVSGRHLVIAGRDRWNPNLMEAKGRLAMITGRQQEYGTANAVYTFLQEYLDVRWLWPGGPMLRFPRGRSTDDDRLIQSHRFRIRPRSGGTESSHPSAARRHPPPAPLERPPSSKGSTPAES